MVRSLYAMEYVKIARVSDFKTVWIKSYKIFAKNIAIVKEKNGAFFATEISCKHNNVDLTTGRFRGYVVTCPRHGWVYDIQSGECLNQPAAPLRKHELKIEGDDIFVSVSPIEGEAEVCDDDDWCFEVKLKDQSGPGTSI